MKPQKFTTASSRRLSEDTEKKNFDLLKTKTNTMRAQRGEVKRLSRNLFIFKSYLSVLCG